MERKIGLPYEATCRRSGVFVEVGRGDLEGRHAELGEEVGARQVEGRAEEGDAELAGLVHQLEPVLVLELERLAMLAVRAAEAVLVVVRLVVHRPRVQRPVVALLELHRVDAALLGHAQELDRLHQRSLVVVADLRDDVASPSSEMRLPSTTSSLMTGDGTATGCQLTVRGVGFGRGAGRSARVSSP